jgi:hypothetical protein
MRRRPGHGLLPHATPPPPSSPHLGWENGPSGARPKPASIDRLQAIVDDYNRPHPWSSRVLLDGSLLGGAEAPISGFLLAQPLKARRQLKTGANYCRF